LKPERTPDWLTFEDARSRILSQAPHLPTECVRLRDALGRALATNQVATATLPPWDNSAMDGYAVRGTDVAGADPASPRVLDVVDEITAGTLPATPVATGQAIRIMTGGPLPSGADTIVRVEDTDGEQTPGRVVIRSDRDVGRHIRPGGEDMVRGDVVVESGTTVTPGVVAVLAALGLAEVEVRRRATVAILTTGDELRGPDRYDDVVAGRGVPDSNGPALAAAAMDAGADPILIGPAPDDADALRAALHAARDADVLITTGGASMGRVDIVKEVLEEEGFRLDFWRARIRPGSPLSFGFLPGAGGSLPVFGLPGNPASAFVTFDVFVRPFLLRMGGHREVLRRTLLCESEADFTTAGDLTHFVRVAVDSSTSPARIRPVGPQGSGLVHTLAFAGGLAIVPREVDRVQRGDPVEVFLLDAATRRQADPAGQHA